MFDVYFAQIIFSTSTADYKMLFSFMIENKSHTNNNQTNERKKK